MNPYQNLKAFLQFGHAYVEISIFVIGIFIQWRSMGIILPRVDAPIIVVLIGLLFKQLSSINSHQIYNCTRKLFVHYIPDSSDLKLKYHILKTTYLSHLPGGAAVTEQQQYNKQ